MLNTRRRATIIGGSLSGLFAGALLKNDGWDVNVYERSLGELESRGGGIVLQPEVVDVFQRLGLDANGPVGVWAEERIFLDRDGSIITRLQMRQKQTSWNAIYQAVRQIFPTDKYHQGEAFRTLRQNATSVVATINGAEVESDLLIGADGSGSAVRNAISSGSKSTYAGYVAFRGLVQESELPIEAADILRDRFSFFHYSQSHMLVYPVASEDLSIEPGRRRFNWVWYRNFEAGTELNRVLTDRSGVLRENSVAPGMLSDDVKAELLKAAGLELPIPMRFLVEATREPFVQAIIDLEVSHMVDGRVVLLGDAAFVPRPHTAASTSKAASDVLALVDVLARGSNIKEALGIWEPSQLQLGRYLRRHGQILGDRSQFPNRTNVKAR